MVTSTKTRKWPSSCLQNLGLQPETPKKDWRPALQPACLCHVGNFAQPSTGSRDIPSLTTLVEDAPPTLGRWRTYEPQKRQEASAALTTNVSQTGGLCFTALTTTPAKFGPPAVGLCPYLRQIR